MKKVFIYFKQIILHPYGKSHFLLTHASKPGVRILDVGCGNNSVRHIKRCCQECYYIGIDVGNYNLDRDSQSKMDEYYVVTPEEFGDKIRELQGSIDIVISSHNIEHCNEPYKVLKNMALSLKMGGGNLFVVSFRGFCSFSKPERNFKFL